MEPVDVRNLIQTLHGGDVYVLCELYKNVFIRGTVPWSDWWTLSQDDNFVVDSHSTRASVDGSSSNLRIIEGPTDCVRMHPLIGSLGGIFDSNSNIIQKPDSLGRPYRKIPSDFDLNSMCMATSPSGVHFIAAGVANLRAAQADMLAAAIK